MAKRKAGHVLCGTVSVVGRVLLCSLFVAAAAGSTALNVDRLATRLLTLPLHPLMATTDVELVCEALQESLRVAGGGAEAGGGV